MSRCYKLEDLNITYVPFLLNLISNFYYLNISTNK